MKPLHLLAGAVMLAAASVPLHAQDEDNGVARARELAVRVARTVNGEDSNRAVLGISTRSTGKRDTLGLLVESITSGSPAEKAGLEEGNRIASVNGVNLKLAPADAGAPEMRGLMTQRLQREMKKSKPGDELKLNVYADGQFKNVTVKTESAAQLDSTSGMFRMTSRENRAAAGLGLGGGGSERDTLGLLVVSVVNDGPADKAGIGEGDRIQSINAVDLRIPASEAQEGDLLGAKEERFSREISKLKPGDTADLKVYSDGAVKDVKITLAKSSDVYPDRGMGNFHFDFNGNGSGMRMSPMPPMPAMAPMPPMPPDVDITPRARTRVFTLSDDGEPGSAERADVMRKFELSRGRMASDLARTKMMASRYADLARTQAMAGSYADMASGYAGLARNRDMLFTRAAAMRDGMRGMSGDMIGFRDLRLAPMNADLASYFGKGAGQGMLVLAANGTWDALKPGDVILSVNGKPVRDGDRTSIQLNSGEQTKFAVIRKGRRQTITVKGEK
ncbi:MAG: PDZ domain-containing protein [Gemmatimonadaceae bacterium]